MLTILAITGPIYIVIGIGFLAGRSRMFSAPDMRVLGKFVVKFALPALLFTALSQRPVADVLNARYLGAYAAGSLIVFFGAMAFARLGQRKTLAQSALIGMGMSFSNSSFVGYPIALQILGPPAAIALAMCMVVENVLLFPLALALAEMDRDGGARWQGVVMDSLAGLAKNPMIVAIFAGFVVSLFGIQLSEPLVRTVNMLAMASTAVALFVIGGSLVGLDVRNVLSDVIVVALGKLVLHPIVCVRAPQRTARGPIPAPTSSPTARSSR